MRLSSPGGRCQSARTRHPLRWICAAAILSLAAGPVSLAARRATPSIEQFQHAQSLRTALEAQPPASRTWKDYEHVLDAYRAVYHQDPQSSKADDSVVAVAELLAEKGRTLHQTRPLKEAIGQYEFLRKQYPYSSLRFAALYSEGSIYRNDLHDNQQAKAKFEEFLQKYPSQPLAADVRSQLQAIEGGGQAQEAASLPPGASTVSTVPAADTGSPHPSLASETMPAASQAAQASVPAEKLSPASENQPTSATSQTAQMEEPEAHPENLQADSEPPAKPVGLTTVSLIRHWSTAKNTRIAINLGRQVPFKYAHLSHPDRIYYDLEGTRLARSLKGDAIAVTGSGFLQRIRAAQFSHDVTRIVLNVGPSTESSAFYLPNPWRLIIDLHSSELQPLQQAKAAIPPAPAVVAQNQVAATASRIARTEGSKSTRGEQPAQAEPIKEGPAQTATAAVQVAQKTTKPLFTGRRATPTSNGKPSLVRTLGLKINRIVIDPGHGGYDSGTLGPGGIEEKNVVLDVALRLGKLLQQQLGEDVFYTRTTDKYVPLEERTAIANRDHADLFISIHANSSRDKAVRGVECYYLNFTTDPGALEVAARENAVSNEQIYELSGLIKKIALSDKVEESREFAIDVQRSLYNGLRQGNPGLKNRGVKRAPFVVLIGANMPSILAEISFLTNPSDAREMTRPAYQERIAESLYKGIAQYIRGLSGIRLAEYPEPSNVALNR